MEEVSVLIFHGKEIWVNPPEQIILDTKEEVFSMALNFVIYEAKQLFHHFWNLSYNQNSDSKKYSHLSLTKTLRSGFITLIISYLIGA